MKREQLQRLARLGAITRREQIVNELALIDKFLGTNQSGRGRRRGMSAAARKAISRRMKAMWRKKRAQKGK